jgi:hypothetical protein
MPTYGRHTHGSTGTALMVSADGSPEWKAGGITIDWATVTAELSDRTLGDGTVIKAGAKGLELGTVLTEIALAEAQTITIDATGGDFTITGNSATTAALAYNASAATVQAAVRGLGGVLANVAVTKVRNRWTLTHTDGTDGGTFALQVARNGVTRRTAALAWNITAANLTAALVALDNVGAAGATATGSDGGPYTLTFAAASLGEVGVAVVDDLTTDGGVVEGGVVVAQAENPVYVISYPAGGGNVAAVTTTATGLTGGAGTAAVATATGGTAPGTYGPYNSAATDGRQALARGRCFILNETVTELGPLGLGTAATDHPAVFEGGRVWRARLKVGVVNPASIGGNAPSVAEFEAAFPRILYVDL